LVFTKPLTTVLPSEQKLMWGCFKPLNSCVGTRKWWSILWSKI